MIISMVPLCFHNNIHGVHSRSSRPSHAFFSSVTSHHGPPHLGGHRSQVTQVTGDTVLSVTAMALLLVSDPWLGLGSPGHPPSSLSPPLHRLQESLPPGILPDNLKMGLIAYLSLFHFPLPTPAPQLDPRSMAFMQVFYFGK